jgi:HPt (histidine-containing phosphotransfer) domain-containing protein
MIDLTFLKEFTGANPDKMKKYINMFLQSAPSHLAKMQESLVAGDYETVKITAHSLKPQMSYMGIKSQEQAIKDIESYAGNRSHLDELPAMVVEFKVAVEQAMVALQMELANL